MACITGPVMVTITMAQSQFVPKAKLFDQLNDIISHRETGLLTILTENNRSIFLRFSQGKLTRLHCRSGEAGEAIQMLAESSMVKYTYGTGAFAVLNTGEKPLRSRHRLLTTAGC